MLIAEFARATGLSVDTVRFYIRQGLLVPKTGTRGGTRPYQEFGPDEVRRAAGIRIGRALGLSLEEIRLFILERSGGEASRKSGIRRMERHRETLMRRVVEMQRLVLYMDEKIAWMKGQGPEPAWHPE